MYPSVFERGVKIVYNNPPPSFGDRSFPINLNDEKTAVI